MTQREIEQALPQFEGLVYTTARQIVAGGVEIELDDARQLLRVKVWHAVQAYDASRDKRLCSLRRFVFGCLANYRKDIEKRPRRHSSSVDELRDDARVHGHNAPSETQGRSDRFDAKYLSVGAEQVFAEVEDEEPVLPATLTVIERQVVALRLQGRLLQEIDRELGLSRARRERALRSIREKLADLDPSATAPRTVPMRPLPHAEPRRAPARAALAA